MASTGPCPDTETVLKAIKTVLGSLYSTEQGTSGEKALQEICKIAESSTPDIQNLTHYKAFTSGLVRNIEACCSGDVSKKGFKEESLIRFHRYRVDCLWPIWQKLFQDLSIPFVRPALVQSVNQHIFNKLLVETLKSDNTTQATEPRVSMSAMEENAVRYSAGYISLKLLKKFEKQDNGKAAEFVECLSNMAVEGDDSRLVVTITAYVGCKPNFILFLAITNTQHSGWRLLTEGACFMLMMALSCFSEL